MIDLTLKFLKDELSQYLAQQPGLIIGDMELLMANASRIFDTDSSSVEKPLTDRPVMSLVNVEEDRVSRQQEPYTKTPLGITYSEPPVLLNLFVLFAMNLKSHEKALRWLSCIIRFFQHQNVFTSVTHPALDSGITQLNVELHTLNFEQSNQLWGMLGGKYVPSVLYKIRQVTVTEGIQTGGGGPIRSIDIRDRSKQAIS